MTSVNILPPELKSQLTYSKRNSKLVRYLGLVLAVNVLLAAIILGTFWFANRQLKNQQQVLAVRQQELASYKQVESDVKALQSNLNLIEKLFNEKTQFSTLLADLAAVLPSGSYINTITLTGDDKKPLKVLFTTDSIASAAAVRNGLITSPRIKSADIQNVTKSESDGRFNVDMLVAFKEGQAR